MRWLLDNIQIVIAVAGLIAYWVNQYRRHKQGNAGEGQGEESAPTYDPAEMEAEEAERTRRIMEEMRRKRAERSGGAQQPPLHQPAKPEVSEAPIPVPAPRPLAAPPPVFRDPMTEMMKEFTKRLQPQVQTEPVIDQQALARQRELEEKLQALEREKRETDARAKALATASVYAASKAREKSADDDWLTSLRDPAGARRAILYTEVFGKPVSLR